MTKGGIFINCWTELSNTKPDYPNLIIINKTKINKLKAAIYSQFNQTNNDNYDDRAFSKESEDIFKETNMIKKKYT